MKFREFLTTNLNEDNVKYAVIRLGGSIGEKITIGPKDIFDNKEAAKENAKVSNKLLSPGDKKYYGIKYTVIELTPKNIQKYNINVNLNEATNLKTGTLIAIEYDQYDARAGVIVATINDGYLAWVDDEVYTTRNGDMRALSKFKAATPGIINELVYIDNKMNAHVNNTIKEVHVLNDIKDLGFYL